MSVFKNPLRNKLVAHYRNYCGGGFENVGGRKVAQGLAQGLAQARRPVSHLWACPGRFHLFCPSPGLGFICFGSPGVQVLYVLAFPVRFHLHWLSPDLGFTCFGILRFHFFWGFPRLRFHILWHSSYGFTYVGSPWF